MLVKLVLLMLIKIGDALTFFLPVHQAIGWPEQGSIVGLFQAVYAVGRFVPLPVIAAVISAMMIFEGALLLYAGYRAMIGLSPGLR